MTPPATTEAARSDRRLDGDGSRAVGLEVTRVCPRAALLMSAPPKRRLLLSEDLLDRLVLLARGHEPPCLGIRQRRPGHARPTLELSDRDPEPDTLVAPGAASSAKRLRSKSTSHTVSIAGLQLRCKRRRLHLGAGWKLIGVEHPGQPAAGPDHLGAGGGPTLEASRNMYLTHHSSIGTAILRPSERALVRARARVRSSRVRARKSLRCSNGRH